MLYGPLHRGEGVKLCLKPMWKCSELTPPERRQLYAHIHAHRYIFLQLLCAFWFQKSDEIKVSMTQVSLTQHLINNVPVQNVGGWIEHSSGGKVLHTNINTEALHLGHLGEAFIQSDLQRVNHARQQPACWDSKGEVSCSGTPQGSRVSY